MSEGLSAENHLAIISGEGGWGEPHPMCASQAHLPFPISFFLLMHVPAVLVPVNHECPLVSHREGYTGEISRIMPLC